MNPVDLTDLTCKAGYGARAVQDAYDLPSASRCECGQVSGRDLTLFADAAYHAGHVDATINAWEGRLASGVSSCRRGMSCFTACVMLKAGSWILLAS